MKTRFFTRPDPARKRKAKILLLIAVAVIAISITGLILVKHAQVFVFTNFGGLVLFFYALLHPWSKARYYALSSLVFLGLLILCIVNPSFFLDMLPVGDLPGHGAEDLAWFIGGIFFAGLIAGIFGVIRCLTFRYHDE